MYLQRELRTHQHQHITQTLECKKPKENGVERESQSNMECDPQTDGKGAQSKRESRKHSHPSTRMPLQSWSAVPVATTHGGSQVQATKSPTAWLKQPEWSW